MAQTEGNWPEFKYKAIAKFDYYGEISELLHKNHVCVVADRLRDLTGGFWVNKGLEFTKGSDCMFFVMAHHITNIEKVAVLHG